MHKSTNYFIKGPILSPISLIHSMLWSKNKKGDKHRVYLLFLWLPCPDSNQEMRHQKPLCYHYTTRQSYVTRAACRSKCGAKLLLFLELQPF